MSFQRTAFVAVGIIGTDPRKVKFGDPLKQASLGTLWLLRGVADDGKVPRRCLQI